VNQEDTSLSDYFLWKPKVSKSFSKNAEASLTFGFYTGKDDYQVWKGYSLPKNTVDLGLVIRF
jgi:hypothetical protein